jgi:hypothetical protein
VTAQQVEELVVCTAVIALGLTLLVVDAERLPPPINRFAKNRAWAVLFIILGLGVGGMAIAGV